MPINRERLMARRDELKLQIEQCKQQFIALNGAIQDLDFLLSEPEDPKEEETKDTQ